MQRYIIWPSVDGKTYLIKDMHHNGHFVYESNSIFFLRFNSTVEANTWIYKNSIQIISSKKTKIDLNVGDLNAMERR